MTGSGRRLSFIVGLGLGLGLSSGCGDSSAPGSAPNTGDCPDDGGAMVRVPEGFCIDQTEVTRGEYFAWLESEPALAGQPEACAANQDLLPACLTTGAWGFDRFLDNPISCVDWCDARAFCEAHGKRLCGGIGGGHSPMDGYDDPGQSEWFAACSSGGEYDYVFGDDYFTDLCHESLRDTWGTTATASLTQCASPDADYAGVFDLGGNVAEWENSCSADGADARCRIRGGGFKHEANGVRCDAGRNLSFGRAGSDDAVGFRCCAD